MSILDYILPPILGAIIALSTNWLAIKMLFRPHKAKYILGFKLPFTPGLIPKERTRLATKIAEAISTRLLTPEVLAKELADLTLWQIPDITIGEIITPHTTDIKNALKNFADKQLPNILEFVSNIPQTHPELEEKLAATVQKVVDDSVSKFASMFVAKGKVYESIKTNILEYIADPEKNEELRQKLHEVIDNLPEQEITQHLLSQNIRDLLTNQASRAACVADPVGGAETGFTPVEARGLGGIAPIKNEQKHTVSRVLEFVAGYLAKNMPIQTMIENKLASFDVAEAEEVILSVAGRELKLIIWLGGLLGFIIGCLMVIF